MIEDTARETLGLVVPLTKLRHLSLVGYRQKLDEAEKKLEKEEKEWEAEYGDL